MPDACMLLMVLDSMEEEAVAPGGAADGTTDMLDSDMAADPSGSCIRALTTAALVRKNRCRGRQKLFQFFVCFRCA